MIEHVHEPVQHRDGREPWCNVCGLTTDGREPRDRRFEQPPAPIVMRPCGHIGSLMVGGVVVGALRCDRPAGHLLVGDDHGTLLTWADADVADPPLSDFALLDPDERFDVEIPDPDAPDA